MNWLYNDYKNGIIAPILEKLDLISNPPTDNEAYYIITSCIYASTLKGDVPAIAPLVDKKYSRIIFRDNYLQQIIINQKNNYKKFYPQMTSDDWKMWESANSLYRLTLNPNIPNLNEWENGLTQYRDKIKDTSSQKNVREFYERCKNFFLFKSDWNSGNYPVSGSEGSSPLDSLNKSFF